MRIQIRFSGDFGTGLEFVEVENDDGESIDIGDWEEDDGDHLLQMEVEDD